MRFAKRRFSTIKLNEEILQSSGSQTPVVAGRLELRGERAGSGVVTVTYGRSYLDNPARNCWYTPWDSNPEPAD